MKKILKTAKGSWSEREGIIIRVELDSGCIGFGEIAPLPAWGSESLEGAISFCASYSGKVMPIEHFESIALPACQFAFSSAILMAQSNFQPGSFDVSYLLEGGHGALSDIRQALDAGYRTFKYKVGAYDIQDEQLTYRALYQEAAQKDAQLRVDANASLSVGAGISWLKLFSDCMPEYFEQPLPVGCEMKMVGWMEEYSVPIALDESIAAMPTIISEYPGPIVIKPSVLGNQSFARSGYPVIYSSALETSIGVQAIIQRASQNDQLFGALGLGLSDYFYEDHFSFHATGPKIESVTSIEPYLELWTQLQNPKHTF